MSDDLWGFPVRFDPDLPSGEIRVVNDATAERHVSADAHAQAYKRSLEPPEIPADLLDDPA